MIDHLEVHTRRLSETVSFYREVLAPLGYELVVDGVSKGLGQGGQVDFWIREGAPSADVHYAFRGACRADVEAAFARSRSHGGAPERAAALAPHIHPNYYAAYARDPDGRLVEFVSHTEG